MFLGMPLSISMIVTSGLVGRNQSPDEEKDTLDSGGAAAHAAKGEFLTIGMTCLRTHPNVIC